MFAVPPSAHALARVALCVQHSHPAEMLQVQVQQLVHHVGANADSLHTGIATCREIGTLLPVATGAADHARSHLMAAVREADSSLRIAELHMRKRNLIALRTLCELAARAHDLSQRTECATASCCRAQCSLVCPHSNSGTVVCDALY